MVVSAEVATKREMAILKRTKIPERTYSEIVMEEKLRSTIYFKHQGAQLSVEENPSVSRVSVTEARPQNHP